jgi:hypothetical protein
MIDLAKYGFKVEARAPKAEDLSIDTTNSYEVLKALEHRFDKGEDNYAVIKELNDYRIDGYKYGQNYDGLFCIESIVPSITLAEVQTQNGNLTRDAFNKLCDRALTVAKAVMSSQHNLIRFNDLTFSPSYNLSSIKLICVSTKKPVYNITLKFPLMRFALISVKVANGEDFDVKAPHALDKTRIADAVLDLVKGDKSLIIGAVFNAMKKAKFA